MEEDVADGTTGKVTLMQVEGISIEDLVRLVALLAAGLTDKVIGDRLGWSERTVRRRVAEISAAVGASSRFQAGYILALKFGPLAPATLPEDSSSFAGSGVPPE